MSQQPFFQKVKKSKASIPNTTTSFFGTLNESIQNDTADDTADDDFLNSFGLPPEDHQRSVEAMIINSSLHTQHSETNTQQQQEEQEENEHEDEEEEEEEENSPVSQPSRVKRHPNYGMKTVRKTPTATTRATSSNEQEGKLKRRRRWLQEIRKHQRSTKNVIPHAPLIRLVRQITLKVIEENKFLRDHVGPQGDFRWKTKALESIHIAAEGYLNELFDHAYNATLHAKRVTLMGRDFKLVQNINMEHNRHSNNPGGKKQASFLERPARKRKNPNPKHRTEINSSEPENSDNMGDE